MKRMVKKLLSFVLTLAMLPMAAFAASAPQVEDGLYAISASTNAKMFKIEKAVLRVDGDKMTVTVTMSGSGYGYLYVGTAEEAVAAGESAWAPYRESADGAHMFTVEISALDEEIEMASYSIKKDQWYDRIVTFHSDGMKPYQEIAEDGIYAAEVRSDSLTDAQCILESADGKMTASITVGDETVETAVQSLDTDMDVTLGGKTHTISIESATLQTVTVVAADGIYQAKITSDSNLFSVESAKLTAKGGTYTAEITANTDKYEALFAGTAADALNASEDQYILAEAPMTYTIPVAALDQPISLATYDEDTAKWYDRTLVVSSASLVDADGNPAALEMRLPETADAQEKAFSFAYTGGTGRVTIECLDIAEKDGALWATIQFSSENYTYAEVDGVQYMNENDGGNSTFTIPVNENGQTAISAETVAMGDPHLVDYTLYLYTDGTDAAQMLTPREEEQPQAATSTEQPDSAEQSGMSAWLTVIIVLAVIVVVGGAVLMVRKNRK